MTSDGKRSAAPPPAPPKHLAMDTTHAWTPEHQLHTGLTPIATHQMDSLSPFAAFKIGSPAGHASESAESAYGNKSDFTTPSYEDDQLLQPFTLTLSDNGDAQRLHPQLPSTDAVVHPPRHGLAPEQRSAINHGQMPTLEEQQRDRERQAANSGVQQWLRVTEPVPDQDLVAEDRQRENFAKRVRAKSAGDAARPRQPLPEDRPESWLSHEAYFFEDESDEPNEDDGYASSDTERARSPSTPVAFDESASQWPSTVGGSGMAPPNRKDSIASSFRGRPWNDPPIQHANSKQPYTSNAAMSRFQQRAKDIETASVTATIGTHRRRSEADALSLYSATGTSILQGRTAVPDPPLPPPPASPLDPVQEIPQPSQPAQPLRHRKSSFIDKIKRQSNHKKRGNDDRLPTPPAAPEPAPLSPAKRSGSWGKSRGNAMRIDTALKHQPRPWDSARDAISKIRSRSPSAPSGLAEIWKQAGGPPVMALGSHEGAANFPPLPPQSYPHTPLQPETTSRQPPPDDDDELVQPDQVMVPSTYPRPSIQAVPQAATMDAFRNHIFTLDQCQVTPHYMVERLAQEQLKRYGRLSELSAKHRKLVGKCSSGALCSKGVGPRLLQPRAQKGVDAAPVLFYINSSEREAQGNANDSTTSVATFPAGVPLPPVPRLPAEFECPLCFQVKKIFKPSDWTKHVHEDVQPFTCTFPDCHDAKSFKRKADWVRHENERHRHLESWHCSFPDCEHKCFRKNNFQEHLVREHKLPEPRERKSANTVPSGESVLALLETCRVDTTRVPEDESCRFCGERCNSWKKLHVHLASHLLQISMPVLEMRGLAEGLEVAASSPHPSAAPFPGAEASASNSRQHSVSSTATKSPGVKLEQSSRAGSTYPPANMNSSQHQPMNNANGQHFLSVPSDSDLMHSSNGPADAAFMYPSAMQTYPPPSQSYQPTSKKLTPVRERQGSWLALEETSPAGKQISGDNLALNHHLQQTPPTYPTMAYNNGHYPGTTNSPDYSSVYGSSNDVPQTTPYPRPSYFASPAPQPRPQTATMIPHQGTFFNEPDEVSGSEDLSPRATAQYHMAPQWHYSAQPGWQSNYTMAPPPSMHAMRSTPLVQSQFPATPHLASNGFLHQPHAPGQKLRKSASHMAFHPRGPAVTQPPTTTGGWI